MRASSARPRLSLDFTVPSGTLSTWAISLYSSSSMSRRITVSRNSGDSFASAPCSNSPASRPASIPSVRALAARPSIMGNCSSIESVARSSRLRR